MKWSRTFEIVHDNKSKTKQECQRHEWEKRMDDLVITYLLSTVINSCGFLTNELLRLFCDSFFASSSINFCKQTNMHRAKSVRSFVFV